MNTSIYIRQKESISKEYKTVLETNLKESLDLLKDIAVDLETSLAQIDYTPSDDKNLISNDESMAALDANYRDMLVELKTIKMQEEAISRIDFENENWYSILQQQLDRDVDVDIDQGYISLI